MKVYGIDVSKWQGGINWNTVATALKASNGGANPGFAILRIGTTKSAGGLNVDKQFSANVAGCEANGVPWGVYFYSYDRSAAAAKKSAQAVVAALKGHKPTYPIYFDVEYEPYNTGKDGSGRSAAQVKADNTTIIKTAMDVLEDAGYFAGIYCSRNFFTAYTNLSELEAYSKWEAAYTSSDTEIINNHMWQYSSKNALGVPGFGQSLDCDVCYLDFPAVIKAAGLNGWAKASVPKDNQPPKAEDSTVDWDASGNDFIITASKGDRPALREVCERLQLPVKNA